MRDLLICFLATAWVLGVIRYMGTRRHPREMPDDIDREYREMVERNVTRRRRCPVHGWDCDNGAAEARRREARRGTSKN